MLIIEKVFDEAIKQDASDIHLICGLKPILRVRRDLIEIPSVDPLTEETLYEIYDYIVKGNVDKDEIFKKTRKLDTSLMYKEIRLRVNVSYSGDIPIFTLRIIKNKLPTFEELGVPEVVRTMTYQPQGLILVTGKTNSGKTTTLNALIDEINKKQNKKI